MIIGGVNTAGVLQSSIFMADPKDNPCSLAASYDGHLAGFPGDDGFSLMNSPLRPIDVRNSDLSFAV